MFKKVLIANRGEIACRIIRTCRSMGISTVAVYSDVDHGAPHVLNADQAFPIGAAEASSSYLNIEKILEVATESGAQAIHPGFGFLSENPEFASACADQGLVFIGPPAKVISAMGSKAEAKRLMQEADIPTLPGYHGDQQEADELTAKAVEIGYPVMIKATAGGGGKGMRVVHDASDFEAALGAARREALSAFADDRVILEKFITRPRHIEFQVFADQHDHCVHLFERDCSVQRRYQKIIEESPASTLDPQLCAEMGRVAVAAAKAANYVNAGTVEFILDTDNQFYFMEMNARLQVEHPVTEMVTGLDLVEWQLLVANGAPLPCRQEQVRCSGHAIECRIYAEESRRGFLPSTGVVNKLTFPEGVPGIRIESGIAEGDAVTVYYDPMLAKLITYAPDRPRAIAAMREALAHTFVAGVETNISFLATLLNHPLYLTGEIDTGYLDRESEALIAELNDHPSAALLACAAGIWIEGVNPDAAERQLSDPWSPWKLADGWRIGDPAPQSISFSRGDQSWLLDIHPLLQGVAITSPAGRLETIVASQTPGHFTVSVDGAHIPVVAHRFADQLHLTAENNRLELVEHDPLVPEEATEQSSNTLHAPMPGRVVRCVAEVGKQVEAGETLLVLEAMKMEINLKAPIDGQVAELRCALDSVVEADTLLLRIDAEGDD